MDINNWLEHSATNKKSYSYTHRLLKEKPEQRNAILADLKKIVEQAHEDTKRRLRKLAGLSLDPFDSTTDAQNQSASSNRRDPTVGYPEKLNLTTLKGYFGEIFAGIVAEGYSHFGMTGWKVPAYPFRFHRSAFTVLEKWRQTGIKPGNIIGREGNDMLAFYRDGTGTIIFALVCEAKCTAQHRTDLIDKAHKQASQELLRPEDILNLVEILLDYKDSESESWVNALRTFYIRDIQGQDERHDLVSYMCGSSPKNSKTWLSTDTPHPNYTAGRKLETVEIHLHDVEKLIKEVYGVSEE